MRGTVKTRLWPCSPPLSHEACEKKGGIAVSKKEARKIEFKKAFQYFLFYRSTSLPKSRRPPSPPSPA